MAGSHANGGPQVMGYEYSWVHYPDSKYVYSIQNSCRQGKGKGSTSVIAEIGRGRSSEEIGGWVPSDGLETPPYPVTE